MVVVALWIAVQPKELRVVVWRIAGQPKELRVVVWRIAGLSVFVTVRMMLVRSEWKAPSAATAAVAEQKMPVVDSQEFVARKKLVLR